MLRLLLLIRVARRHQVLLRVGRLGLLGEAGLHLHLARHHLLLHHLLAGDGTLALDEYVGGRLAIRRRRHAFAGSGVDLVVSTHG